MGPIEIQGRLAHLREQRDDYLEEIFRLRADLAAEKARAEKAEAHVALVTAESGRFVQSARVSRASEEHALERIGRLAAAHSEELAALREYHRDSADNATRAYGAAVARAETAEAMVRELREMLTEHRMPRGIDDEENCLHCGWTYDVASHDCDLTRLLARTAPATSETGGGQ